MFAANVFHWWLGVIFTAAGVLAVVATAAGYLKKVTSMQHPGKRQREE
jgi:hypothetical protein